MGLMSAPRAHVRLDPDRCTGCRLCELACVEDRYGPVPGETVEKRLEQPTVYERRRLRIVLGDVLDIEVCDHCEAHPCVAICPHHALLAWPSGQVDLREDRCTGCGKCIAACDRHAIRRVNALDIAVKCDGCAHRPGEACVEACPEDALTFA